MGIFLTNNATSIAGVRHLNNVTRSLNTSIERLSSGYRLNRAADGPADWAVAENLTAQVRGLAIAERNVQSGISMLDIADGALQTINTHLQRLNEIAIEAQNAGADYTALEAERGNIETAITNIISNTKYGSNSLLGGASGVIQAGANAADEVDISTSFAALTVTVSQAVSDATSAESLATQVDTALTNVNARMAIVGGHQKQLENQLNAVGILRSNFSAAEASVRGADIAAESANMMRNQILQQAAAAALAQANQMPSIALRLLQ